MSVLIEFTFTNPKGEKEQVYGLTSYDDALEQAWASIYKKYSDYSPEDLADDLEITGAS